VKLTTSLLLVLSLRMSFVHLRCLPSCTETDSALYVLTSQNCEHLPELVLIRFVLFAQKATIVLLNAVKRLSFVMETPCVFREVKTRGLVNICVIGMLRGVKEARV